MRSQRAFVYAASAALSVLALMGCADSDNPDATHSRPAGVDDAGMTDGTFDNGNLGAGSGGDSGTTGGIGTGTGSAAGMGTSGGISGGGGR